MDFITPTTTAAGVRAVGSLGAALVGKYRPIGVPRVGSAEDRAEAYRTFLDAMARAAQDSYMFTDAIRNKTVAAAMGSDHRALLSHMMAGVNDVMVGLGRVQLCGPPDVVAAAEDMIDALTAAADRERQREAAQGFARLRTAREVYLEACRRDLSYDPAWWNLWRKWKNRRYLKAQAARARAEAGERPATR